MAEIDIIRQLRRLTQSQAKALRSFLFPEGQTTKKSTKSEDPDKKVDPPEQHQNPNSET